MDFLYRILITHNRPWSVREIIFFSIFFLILAGILLRQLRCKKLNRVQFWSWIVLYVFLSVVFASTVFTRTPEERHYELYPFCSWKEVLINHNVGCLEGIILNIILFLPVGGILPVLSKKISWKHALGIGAAISAVIELSQLIFCRGWFSWDDLLHNTLGCVSGYLVVRWLFGEKMRKKA